MAKMRELGRGLEEVTARLNRLERGELRKAVESIVRAGADAAVKDSQERFDEYRHRRTGETAAAVGPSRYYESLWGGSQYVYPQGADADGQRYALKAYVVNFGRGRNPTRAGGPNRTGDKFLTGKFSRTEEAVRAAMEQEADRILREAGLTD